LGGGTTPLPSVARITSKMQNANELNATFALPGALVFDEPHPGMPRAHVTTPACTAEVYLQGAHLTGWQPVGQQPVLFLSERTLFAAGKAIRGGIPVIFPWFGSPETSPVVTAPGVSQHGFARTSPWTLRFAALAGDDLHLSATLDQTEAIRALGFSGFELACEFILGRTLTVRLSVANTGDKSFLFEEALHAYLEVSDAERVSVDGLQGIEFLDKTDDFVRKTQTEPMLQFRSQTDRPYLNTQSPLTLRDPVLKRDLRLEKKGSKTTVTWNPAAELAATLKDLAPGAWRQFVCLETANVAENAVTLLPREAHTMEMRLSVHSHEVGG